MSDRSETTLPTLQNPAETMRDVMEKLNHHDPVVTPEDFDLSKAHMITVPHGRGIHNLTANHLDAVQFLKPARRKGTARMEDLQSLIGWAERFKGETSACFAMPDMSNPSITCIADYHAAGEIDVTSLTGDATARHCHHRAIYKFPLSEEWKAWKNVSDKPIDKDQMGEFIEANAKDIMDPTAAVLKMVEETENQPWENRLIRTAQQIEGRYGQLTQLLAMSRQFQVYEKSNLTVTSNRDTGESSIQFTNEHNGPDGKPLILPNLIIIAIPVFLSGAPYRMPVRFRYRKIGGEVKFILSVYNPEKAFEAAFNEAVATVQEQTSLPMFRGSPEA